MTKKIFSLALLLFFASHMTAKTRSAQEILNLALQTLNQKSVSAKKKAPKSTNDLYILRQDSQLTLVCDNNQKCIIISNDDTFMPILGYTDKPIGKEMAPGFLWWLQAMNTSLEAMLSNNTHPTKVPKSEAYQTAVPELMSTKWGQDMPYNKFCPEYKNNGESTHYVTGCVATAMAQIMNYHQYPLKGVGKYSYRYNPGDGAMLTLVADFKNTTYDWNNMLDEYTDGAYNEAQADAVATLMYHCGVSVKMNYTKDGSGAYTAEACKALRKYFAYNPTIKTYDRRFFPIDEWMQIIYREINDKCPVLYGGQSVAGGHEFVFDGYNEDGLVHVNWGWNGSQDGYFDIASLNGFSSGQQMVVVRPTTDVRYNEPYTSLWGLNAELNITKLSNNLTVKKNELYNMDVDDFAGKISLVAKGINNQNFVELNNIYDSTDKIPYLNGFSYNDFKINTESLPDGQYRLYFASKSIEESDWQPVRSYETSRNSYILVISNGFISSLTAEKTSNWTASAIQVASNEPQFSQYIYIYDLQGQEIYRTKTSDFNMDNIPGKGIFIIKQGSKTTKVSK